MLGLISTILLMVKEIAIFHSSAHIYIFGKLKVDMAIDNYQITVNLFIREGGTVGVRLLIMFVH